MPINRALTPWHRPRPAPTTPARHAARSSPLPATLPTLSSDPMIANPSATPARTPPIRRCASLPSSLHLSPLHTMLPQQSLPASPLSPLPAANSPSSTQPNHMHSASSETASLSSPASSGRSGFLEVFLPPGRHEEAARFAYVHHAPLSAVLAPAPFIWAAVRAALPNLCFDVLPSSRGTLLLRFLTAADRDVTVRRSPLLYEDVQVVLERHDHATVSRNADVMVALSVQDFPLSHWNARYI
jgi:hypothetical protein